MATDEAIRLHHDIVALRAKYEATAETTTAQAVNGLIVLTGLYLDLTGNDLIVGLAFAR